MKDNIQTLAARIEERLIAIGSNVQDIKDGFKEHTEKDDQRFSNLNKYMIMLGAVSLAMGWFAKTVLAG